jgi:hypothetical protein
MEASTPNMFSYSSTWTTYIPSHDATNALTIRVSQSKIVIKRGWSPHIICNNKSDCISMAH